MIEARVQIDTPYGDPAARVERLRFALRPSSLELFLIEKVRPYLRARTEGRFAGEGDDVVGKWAELAAATGLIRRSHGFGAFHPINVRTGDLKRWVTGSSEVTVGGRQAVLTIPDRRGGNSQLGKKLRHAQQGGIAPGGSPFPARPVLALGRRDMAKTVTMLEDWIRTHAA